MWSFECRLKEAKGILTQKLSRINLLRNLVVCLQKLFVMEFLKEYYKLSVLVAFCYNVYGFSLVNLDTKIKTT